MAEESSVKLTISFIDPELDAEERDAEAQRLSAYLRDLDEVEAVERVVDPNPPEGNMAVGGFLAGLLLAEINVENGKRVLGFLGDRLGGKPIELEAEKDGKKIKVTAYSQEELKAAIDAAKEFFA